MKTPDVLSEAIQEVVEDIEDEEERETITTQATKVADRFVQYGEYVRVELDLAKNTATVLEWS